MRQLSILALVLAAQTFASAQPAAPDAEPAPVVSPAMPSKAAMSAAAVAKAQEVLAKARTAYAAIKTYQDKTSSTFVPVTEDGDAREKRTSDSIVRFKRPDMCLVKSDQLAFASDGKTITNYQGEYKQYTTAPLEGSLNDVISQMQYSALVPPTLRILAAGDGLMDTLFTGVLRVLGSEPEKLNDANGTVVYVLVLSDPRDPGSLPIPLTAWFDETTSLLGRTVVDFGPAYNLMARQMENEQEQQEEETGFHGPAKFKSALLTHTFTDIKVDAELGDESLAFVPPADAEKTNAFHKVDRSAAAQREMLKNLAPAFATTDCEGKPISLADFKGRVVLLDFWATWCGPCVAAMPQMQDLANKFDGQPVTILGINGDTDKSAADIQAFLDKKKVTIRQALDPKLTIGESYNVNAIPCVVFIDKDGKIADVVTGFSTGHASEFSLRIQNLLDGKPIHEGSELAEQAAADPEDMGGTFPIVDDNSPEALALKPIGTAAGTAIISSLSRMIDVDHNGTLKLVAPLDRNEPPAGLAIFHSDGRLDKRLPLELAANGTIAGFDFGLNQWSVVHQTNSSAGLGRVSIMGYGPEGKRLWKYRVDTASDRSATAKLVVGDLAGDGKPHTAVLITSYVPSKSGSSRTSITDLRTTLLVLSETGQPLSFRRIGQNASSIAITPPATKGESPSILVTADGRLLKFTFDASKAIRSDADPK